MSNDPFKHADDVAAHLGSVIGDFDPVIASKYVGLLSVAAVAVFEVAIKEIFITFAIRKHPILAVFTEKQFHRINGKISLDSIRDEYLPRFGDVYLKAFKTNLESKRTTYFKSHRRDICESYKNIIAWRNSFAHTGAQQETFGDVLIAYQDGKEIIQCLAEAMN